MAKFVQVPGGRVRKVKTKIGGHSHRNRYGCPICDKKALRHCNKRSLAKLDRRALPRLLGAQEE
jgi:hypothetical protein